MSAVRDPAHRNGPATRAEILNTLRHEPGLTKSQVCRMLDLSWGTISHHVRLLEAEGLLLRRFVHGRLRLFLASTSQEQMALIPLAREPVVPAILRSLDSRPGLGIQQLAGSLSVDRRVVRKYLHLLIDSGLVAQTDDYRPKFFVVERTRTQQFLQKAQEDWARLATEERPREPAAPPATSSPSGDDPAAPTPPTMRQP